MKKLVSILLIVVFMFASFVFPATAEEEYTVLFKNDEVTSVDGLLSLYKAQKKVEKYDAILENKELEEAEDSDQIIVGQIVEARQYKDGKKAYVASLSGVSVMQDGELLRATDMYNGNYGESGQSGNVSVRLKVYVTFYYDSGMRVRLDKVSATVTNKGSLDIVSVALKYGITLGFGSEIHDGRKEIDNLGLNIESVLYNTKYSKYIIIDRIQDQMSAACVVNVTGTYNSSFAIDVLSAEIRDFCYSFLPY